MTSRRVTVFVFLGALSFGVGYIAGGVGRAARRREGRAEERDAIIALARQLGAVVPADRPKGAMASFADCLRVQEDDSR